MINSRTNAPITQNPCYVQGGLELGKIYNESNLDTMKRMPDNFVDLIVTSPPYNINLRIRGNEYCRRSKNDQAT